jgi:hypothetical protein
MNCKQCQEKIVDALAGGEALPVGKVSAHLQACRLCQEFYEAQGKLFGSIELGLQSIANQQVPPSLLPGLQTRLDQQTVTPRLWVPSWSFAVVIAIAILSLSVSHMWRQPLSQRNVPEVESVVSGSSSEAGAVAAHPRELVKAALPKPTYTRRNRKVLPSVAPETVPEVIVLSEEREAFARFVAVLPKENDVALALTRPAPVAPDLPLEIALLQIQNVEVKPLVSVQGSDSAN